MTPIVMMIRLLRLPRFDVQIIIFALLSDDNLFIFGGLYRFQIAFLQKLPNEYFVIYKGRSQESLRPSPGSYHFAYSTRVAIASK
jgi:hypothetical protein